MDNYGKTSGKTGLVTGDYHNTELVIPTRETYPCIVFHSLYITPSRFAPVFIDFNQLSPVSTALIIES